jgi:hypothetical protein
MKQQSSYVDADKWSERLGLPYVKQEWFNYRLGTGWGDRQGSNAKANMVKVGHIHNLEGKRNLSQKLNVMLDSIINGDWEYATSLYGGLIAFCFKYCADDISYYEDNRNKNTVSVIKCCEELKFPNWCRSKLEKIFKMSPSLKDYLYAFDNVPQVNFDVDSALMVYKMQGEKAIFSILMQLFFRYKYTDVTIANLVPELPIIWTPKVSNLVNGTDFPVVATRFSNEFYWKQINGSFFLFDEFDNPIDCANCGRFNVFSESLGNRLSFLSQSGEFPWYLICWNWGDLVKAVGHFHGDILVRNLSGGYNKWFRFGLGGQLAAFIEGPSVFSKKGNKSIPNIKVKSYPQDKRVVGLINLNGKRVSRTTNAEVVWNWEEMCDWFELGKLCKRELQF